MSIGHVLTIVPVLLSVFPTACLAEQPLNAQLSAQLMSIGEGDEGARTRALKEAARLLYPALLRVPTEGVSASEGKIAAAQDFVRRLAASDDPRCQLLALRITSCLARALTYELRRHELLRTGKLPSFMPAVTGFDPGTLDRLWDTNCRLADSLLAKALSFGGELSTRLSEEGASNEKIAAAVAGLTASTRVTMEECQRMGSSWPSERRQQSDYILAQVLSLRQRMLDAGLFFTLFREDGKLPDSYEASVIAIRARLEPKREVRLDDGLRQSTVEAVSNFYDYARATPKHFECSVTILFLPLLPDWESVPGDLREIFGEWPIGTAYTGSDRQ